MNAEQLAAALGSQGAALFILALILAGVGNESSRSTWYRCATISLGVSAISALAAIWVAAAGGLL